MKYPHILLLSMAITHNAVAFMAIDSNVILSGTPDSYALTVYQNFSATDWTSIWFDRDEIDLIFRTYNLDEGSDWYFCAYNDEFSANTVSDYTLFNQMDQRFTVGYGDFYLGVNTGNGFIDFGVPNRNIYGWAHLNNTPDGLELLGSAISYDGQGIYVGTTQTIPEPSCLSLLMLGIPLFPVWRNRMRTRRCWVLATSGESPER